MKTIISFDVHGPDLAALQALALKTYQDLVGEPDAELPHSATIEVTTDIVVEAMDGTKIATEWRGVVTITRAADGTGSR